MVPSPLIACIQVNTQWKLDDKRDDDDSLSGYVAAK